MKLTGGLEYCKFKDCTNTVHHEDAPEFYPCCQKHKKANIAYWEIKKENKILEEINKELFEV